MHFLTEKQRIYVLLNPESTRSCHSRAYSGSKANAVKAKCLDCTLNNRDEIKFCAVQTCPLWSVRPYQVKEEGLDDEDE